MCVPYISSVYDCCCRLSVVYPSSIQGRRRSVMNRIPTQGSRRTRVVSIVGLAAFFLITMLTMNFNVPFGLVKQAHAAALKPATTPALPSVGITSPSNNSLYTLPTQIPLTATATDSNPGFTITRVEFYSTSLTSTTPTLIGTVLTAPYTLTWTPSQPSIYTVTAKAYDRTGSQTSAPISVTVQIQAPPPMPAVTITSPANNALLGQYMRIPVTASFAVANPSSIVKVEFYATQSGGTAMLIGTAT